MDYDRIASMELYVNNLEQDLEKVAKQRDELLECLRNMVDMAQGGSDVGMWVEENKAMFDQAVAAIGKAVKGDL